VPRIARRRFGAARGRRITGAARGNVGGAGRGGAGRAGAGRAGAGRGGSGRVGSGRTKHHPDGLARTGDMPPLQMCVGWATIEREFTRAMRSPQPFLHCRCACKSVSLLISWADQQVK